ncbi:MAG: AraC family transcriptional regulator [Oscillospiraceae bacterium]|nr:AraC family transcriptional regulator [Oscillospiraceae bacterium]
MRVLAITNRGAVPECDAAAMGSSMLAFFDAPALLHGAAQPLSMAPQTLWLCRPMNDALYAALAKNAAFTVRFDAADAPVQLDEETQCIALTSTDAPPTAAQFCGIGAQLADVFCSSMPTPVKDTVCDALLSALLAMYDAVAQYRRRDVARHHNRARLIALRQAIYRDPSAPWSIEQMCTQINVSRTHLHRIYQETFGVGCHTDVLQSRLLHAMDMLVGTDASVREIALACGFENDITFMRAFKKHRGCTPTTYRHEKRISSECTIERP